jgi:hypothetical protein
LNELKTAQDRFSFNQCHLKAFHGSDRQFVFNPFVLIGHHSKNDILKEFTLQIRELKFDEWWQASGITRLGDPE